MTKRTLKQLETIIKQILKEETWQERKERLRKGNKGIRRNKG